MNQMPDESSNLIQEDAPQPQIFYADSTEAEHSSTARILLIVFVIIIGIGILAAGIIYWIQVRDFPVVAAANSSHETDQDSRLGKSDNSPAAKSPVSQPDNDPLRGQGASIPVSNDMLHVTSIALGSPRLTIVNGKRLAIGDWLVLKTPAGNASVRIESIEDGSVQFKHGDQIIDAPLQVIPPSPNSPKPSAP